MLDFSQPFLEKGEKVVCLGDSLTAGANSYVKFLQEMLPDNTVINSGEGGDKTPHALTRFQPAVLDHKPDALFIFLGANDAAVGRGIWADEPVVTPEAYRCNLVWIAHLCRLRGVKKFSVATAFGFEGPSYLGHGRVLEPYYFAAREAADEIGARIVPLDTLFEKLRKGAPLNELLVTRDGTHPLPETQKLIADAMLEAWAMNK